MTFRAWVLRNKRPVRKRPIVQSNGASFPFTQRFGYVRPFRFPQLSLLPPRHRSVVQNARFMLSLSLLL